LHEPDHGGGEPVKGDAEDLPGTAGQRQATAVDESAEHHLLRMHGGAGRGQSLTGGGGPAGASARGTRADPRPTLRVHTEGRLAVSVGQAESTSGGYMNQTRVEEDLLGTREVPADAYYGVHTVRAVENFPIADTTISDVPDFIRGMVMVKKAAALA